MISLLILLQAAAADRGDKRLNPAPLFREHAVLQRDIPIPVWGAAAPNHQIRCTLGTVQGMTVSNDDGRFFLRLPPLPAGGPWTLRFEDVQSGESIEFQDVWTGEVYLVSGQSNMALPLRDLDGFAEWQAEGRLNNPEVRYFKVPLKAMPTPAQTAAGSWQLATEKTTGKFSGIGFLFAEKTARETGVKVGIIEASRGGTGIECWMSREALVRIPFRREKLLKYDVDAYRPEHYAELPPTQILPAPDELIFKNIARLFPAPPPNEGLKRGYAEVDFDDSGWERMELPDSWTVSGYNHAGVFWFRLAVDLPEAADGKEYLLSLGAVDKGDITYFNGVEVGRTGDGIDMNPWATPRTYRVTGKAGRNIIAVRAASLVSIAMDGGLVGPAGQLFLRGGNVDISLATTWRFKMEYDAGTLGSDFMPLCGPGEPHSMHILFDNMIAPLVPYALRGVLWYQGECNAIAQAGAYGEMLKGLISDWRYRWGQADLHFLVVQLPGYQAKRLVSPFSQWAVLREAQGQCGEPVIVSCDTGDENDLHPRDKELIAGRASAVAVALLRKQEPPRSPRMKSVKAVDGKLRVEFDTAGSSLRFQGEPDGFAVGEDDKELRRAKVSIIAPDTLEIAHPEGKEPRLLYYGWSNFPTGNLYNSANLPAMPFRWKQSNSEQ